MSSYLFFLFGDKGSVLSEQSIAGIAKLKIFTDNPEALRAIEKVEKNHALLRMVVLITKIAVVTFDICFIPTLTALIPIAALALALNSQPHCSCSFQGSYFNA